MLISRKAKRYRWTGINLLGESCKGQQLAFSRSHLKEILQQKQITLLHSRPVNPLTRIFQASLSQHILQFSQELVLLLKSAIPLDKILDILSQAFPSSPLQTVITNLKLSVAQGDSLTHALQQHPSYFDPMYCSFIYAGEQTGKLPELLTQWIRYQEKITALKKKIHQALRYPLTIFISLLLIMVGLMGWVIPQFQSIFLELNVPLPLSTRILLTASHHTLLLFYILLGFVVTICLTFLWFRQSELWRYRLHRFALSLPIVGPVQQITIFMMWFTILSNTYAAGIPLLNSLELATRVLTNLVFKQKFTCIGPMIQSGQTLHAALLKTTLFSARTLQLISLGEISGELSPIFKQITKIYKMQWTQTLNRITALLKPTVMLLLAILISGVILAMYLPIFSMGAAL